MRKWMFLFCCLFVSSQLPADIIEESQLDVVWDLIDGDTLLLLDIDNTLMNTVQELGSDQWFRRRIRYYEDQGYDFGEALERALSEWTAIQYLTDVETVQPDTSDIIRRIQDAGLRVMGLTTRSYSLARRTVEQLRSLGIDLSRTAFGKQELFFQASQGILYRGGIVFCSGINKGDALEGFLDLVGFHPKRIVFVDDRLRAIKQVEKACQALGIPFIGIRYSHVDDKIANFRDDIAAIQFRFFGRILSDDEAQAILDGAHTR